MKTKRNMTTTKSNKLRGKNYGSKTAAKKAAERQAGHQATKSHPDEPSKWHNDNTRETEPKRAVKAGSKSLPGLYETRAAAERAAERRGGKDKVEKMTKSQVRQKYKLSDEEYAKLPKGSHYWHVTTHPDSKRSRK